MKLQYGEYVSLGKVETVLKTHPLVDNVCVIGSSLSTFIVALIQPSEPALRKLAETAGLTTAGLNPAALPMANLCDDKRVTELAANDLIAHCMKGKWPLLGSDSYLRNAGQGKSRLSCDRSSATERAP